MDEFPVRDRSLLPSLAAAHKSERVGVMDPGRARRDGEAGVRTLKTGWMARLTKDAAEEQG